MSATFFICAVPDELDGVTELLGVPVHYCGVGKLNAALGIFHLHQLGAKRIINIGSCGSLRHPLGEILRIGKVVQDIDCTPLCDYGQTAFDTGTEYFVLDAASPHTCFTTDYFYDQKQSRKYSPAYLQQINTCSLFDMELYGMAKTCNRYNIELHAYKWVSDDGDHEKWVENCRLSLQRTVLQIGQELLT